MIKRKSNLNLILFVIFYFIIDFVINFIFIKILGGYDNRINYDLSVIYSRLFIFGIFILLIIINKNIFEYLKFRPISIKKILLFLGASIFYSFLIIFIRNKNFNDYNFHWLQYHNYFLLSAIFIAPFYEEIFKKGLPIEYLLRKKISPIFVTIFISFLFCLTHLPSLEQVFYGLILGIITSLIYIKERNIIYPIIFHFVYNFIILCIS
ncbi:CPBP family intramembrane glutamic endopeptidase [Chryseobacterium gambrini]|uniref:CPBP family intramembrane glutamic endopeptidase n=1 Tax=Chryseobacterium gambrini TaxID=373672 RepID=UPI003BAE4704